MAAKRAPMARTLGADETCPTCDRPFDKPAEPEVDRETVRAWVVGANTQVQYDGVVYGGGENFDAPLSDDVDLWVKSGWIEPAK